MRILIVEDNAEVGDVWSRALKHAGHEVEHVFTVGKALHVLEAAFDVVVLDIRLSDGYGHEVVKAARASGARIVAASGIDCSELDLSLFDAVVQKPAFPSDLIEAIRGAIT